MKTAKIIHNRKRCIGCNSCVEIAPQNWKISEEDGLSNLIGAKEKKDIYIGEILEIDIAANKTAAEACPMNIIKVEE